MHLCYVDESGTPELPGTTSHYVLAGISVPIWQWRNADVQINEICRRYDLAGCEIHTGWLLRNYAEQTKVPHFEHLDRDERRAAVRRQRAIAILETRRRKNPHASSQLKKNFKQTEDYIHLTRAERAAFIVDIAYLIASWDFAVLFAECIDKLHVLGFSRPQSVDEQAFEQVISRFEQYLDRVAVNTSDKGLVVHDNNPTVAKKHTDLMRRFHLGGTLWTKINRIIETPMFVDSKLTSLVQMADLCSYAIRRYLENGEDHLFNIIYGRSDTIKSRRVGVRHFTAKNCNCVICTNH